MIITPPRDSRLIIISKTVTQVVNNSAALVNDNALAVNLPADSNWFWWLYLMVLSSVGADLRLNMVKPAGTTNTTYMDFDNNSRVYGINWFPACSGSEQNLYCQGHLHIVGGGGAFYMQFAQQVAEVSDSTVYAGSCLWLLRTA